MKIKGRFRTTGIGSLPYLDPVRSAEEICSKFDIPFWPQLPKRSFKENMYVQFAEGLPSLIIDEEYKKIHIDTSKDLSEGLSRIYETYLSEDYSTFGLTRDFAEGFHTFFDVVKKFNKPIYVKGQVTGPVSFGLSIVDEKGKSIIYNDALKEPVIKLLEIKASYQIDRLKDVSKNIIIFIDEPYLTNFGSSFVSIERQDVILMLGALVDKIHSKGALVGIHCCGNTDWPLVIETGVDIINFDAYSYTDSISLYPIQIHKFLDKGGYLAWGIVPTSEKILEESNESLFDRLSSSIDKLAKKGIPRNLIVSHSLLTPSCGMGTLSLPIADLVIERLYGAAVLAKDRI